MTEQEALELLGALGRVDRPSDGALVAAREALWSVVAAEMLSAGLPEDIRARRAPPRRRPGQARSPDRRRGAPGE